MSQSTQLKLDHKFDAERMRHYLNGQLSVLHCHHYATLYTQLAIDAKETTLLAAVAEETFGGVLRDYFDKNGVESVDDRIAAASNYFATVGLGKMSVSYLGNDSGQIVMEESHVDRGWIKKWGQFDAPVNHIGRGYIAGMFSAIWDKPLRTFKVRETESIVTGAEKSCFKVYKD
jgi:predicted hydrocarbon binding protein